MNLITLVIMGCGTLLFGVMMVFAFAGPSSEKAKTRRLAAVRERHSASVGAVVEAQLRRIQASRATRMDGFASRIIPNPAELQKRIAKTGKDWTPAQILIVSGVIFAVVAIIVGLKSQNFLLSVLAGTALGAGLPHIAIGYLAGKRIKKFTKNFPDAIELLVRGLRSGLPISETLGVVGQEVPGAVGEEFRGVADRIRIGRTMDAALQETADRLGTPEFQFFCITLAIQRETGGNLAETLGNLATVLRQRAQMKMKVAAMSSESKASAYIIGSLPFIIFTLIYTINPAYMSQFFTNPELIKVGLGGLGWMSIGALIMWRMISFEI